MQELFHLRARENLQAAERLFELELFNASANRAYYAAFHAALATLFRYGFTPNIDHKAVQSMFNGELINRRKIVPAHLKQSLQQLQDVRNIADYKNGVSKAKAADQLKKAVTFCSIILKDGQ
jgi:uncharacterized protein (UPF0332 family)